MISRPRAHRRDRRTLGRARGARRLGGGSTSTPETWDAFFDDFYLRAYADEERDAEAGSRRSPRPGWRAARTGGEVLDVPCGFGRHAIPLARAGYRVTGVDRSTVAARRGAAARGRGAWPKFVNADYRELPFKDEAFDAAINLYTSLGYLGDEEDTKVLAAIRRVLREGGAARDRDDAPRPARGHGPTATGG